MRTDLLTPAKKNWPSFFRHVSCHVVQCSTSSCTFSLMPKHLDSLVKNRFIGALQAGLNVSQLPKRMTSDSPSAKNLAEKFQETGSTHHRPGSGRPTKATSHVQRSITKEATKDRRKPLADIGRSVTPIISTSTVRRVLADRGSASQERLGRW